MMSFNECAKSSAVATPEASKYPPSLSLVALLSGDMHSPFSEGSKYHPDGVTHGNRALSTAAVLSGSDSMPSCAAPTDLQLSGKNLRSLSPSNVNGEISRRRPVSTSVV